MMAAIVLEFLDLLTNPTPMGDDALVHIKKIIDLAGNFLQFQWDPRSFNGYRPSTGFAWASYGPPSLFVSLGFDPTLVFHLTFVSYFLLIGPSIYYFAQTVGARRIVALAVSVLGWSTTGYWGYVGGGAYSRVFTLPFMFIALGLTFRYMTLQNQGRPGRRTYWLLLTTWFLTFLGDVYIGIVPVLVAIPFILLSAGRENILVGLRRLGVILLPVLVLTSWFWVPLAIHALAVGSPPSDVTVSTASQVFWVGPIFSVATVFARKRSSNQALGPEHAAILFSLNLVSIYFLVMGAITPLWPYLPRIWATYDSFNILSFLFPLTVACLFVWLKPLRRGVLAQYLAMALIILVIINASVTISLSRPPDRSTLNTSLAQAFQGNFVVSDNYRVSLQGRASTRWFPSYYPDASQTGGRVLGLNPNPFYQSWYGTEVFFKDDLATLKSVYIEDQPTVNVTSLIGAPQNFASTSYWLDWYGVNTLVLDPGLYPVQNTAQNFSQRGALFSTNTAQTFSGPLVFINPTNPGPILIATNGSTIGFYSQQGDSEDQYNDILGLLSYLGLDSRYVVPVHLPSLDTIGPDEFNLIITDQSTYFQTTPRFIALEGQGTRILVVSTGLLARLQTQGTIGAQGLIKLISPVSSPQVQNLTEVSSYPSQTLIINPQEWTTGFYQNAQGSLQTNQNNLTISIAIQDTTKLAQFDVGFSLPNPAVLWDQLEPHLQLEADVRSNIGLVFTSSNFTDNFVAFNEKVNPSQLVDLRVPFTNFTTWNYPQSKFATATGLTLAVTVPPGNPNATVRLTYASLSERSYTFYETASVSLSAAGFLQAPTAQGLVLSDETGSLAGSTHAISQESTTMIIPLAAFSSSTNGNFTRVILVGGSQAEPVSLALFTEAPWTSLRNEWTTNQNLSIQAVPGGYSGLVWKETYSSSWNIVGTDQAGNKLSLSYFLAGPGLVYVPLRGKVLADMSISYQDIVYNFFLPALSALTVIPLVLFRRKIYLMGTTKGRTS